MSKQEADRLADALAYLVHFSSKSRDWCNAAADLLSQWPDGKPVAWVDDLTRAAPHCVTDLKYCSVTQHDRGEHLKYVPLYTAPPDSAARIAELEAQRDALRRLIADDSHAMTFQTLGQYRSALLAAIKEVQR